jgi:hypothetical protein
VEIEFIMARRHAIIDEENLRIPEDALTFEGFERWIDSGEFPETGRIDYLEGDVEVGMSPEDLYTHGTPKTAISSKLHVLVAEAGIPELWLVDARDEDLRFEIQTLHGGRYETVRQDGEGWTHSPCLRRLFRLVRREQPELGACFYKLEDREG